MPLQKHCQLTSDEPHSALFSCSAQQGISQFLFLGFLSLSPCHCGGFANTPHSQPAWCKAYVSCMPVYSLKPFLKHLCTNMQIYILVSAGWICICVPICGSKPLVEGSEHRLKKTGMRSETTSRTTRVQDFKWKLFQTEVPSAFTLESDSKLNKDPSWTLLLPFAFYPSFFLPQSFPCIYYS